MIHITTISFDNKHVIISGHSGFAKQGEDIVCSAISTASQYLILAGKCDYKIDNAYLKIDITKCDPNVIQAFIEIAKQLREQYPSYVEWQ